jgi:hypothetical protein
MKSIVAGHSDGLPRSERAASFSGLHPRKWLRQTFLLPCVLAGLAGCARFEPGHSNPALYVLLDRDGPTGLKVTGFMPGCASSCLDEVVRKAASWASSAPVIAVGSNQPSPRRWLVINFDQRSMPHPVAQLTGRMVGPGDSYKSSSTSAPAYESGPPIVFEHSIAAFTSRFFGSVDRK